MSELSHPATDLVMWIENTRGYNETVQTINATMARRWIRDEFDLDSGIRGYRHIVKQAAQNYMLRFGGMCEPLDARFPKPVREEVQEHLARLFVTYARGNPEVWEDLGEQAARVLAKG